MLEGKFNNTVQKSIKSLGIFCFKSSDRHKSGIPDIYVSGATWMEGKVIRIPQNTFFEKEFNLAKTMSENQHRVARKLIEGGDRYLFYARIEGPIVNHLLVVPYYYLISKCWRYNDIEEFPIIESEKRYDLGIYFENSIPGYLDMQWYNSFGGKK